MPPSPLITSTTNARIKAARKLQRRRARYAQGRLLVEGVRLVRDAWAAGAQLEEVYFVPEQTATNPAADALMREVSKSGMEMVACSAQVFAELAETVTPQGIAAVVALPNLALPDRRDLILVLDRLRDPGNAGTLLRSAEAAGVAVVVFGPETVDPFNEKVVRAGMGAHFRLPLRVCETWEAVAALLLPGQALYMAAADATLDYADVAWQEPVALIVGGEAEGVGPEARSVATPITIPMMGQVESLNAGVAGSVILFEAARQRRSVSSR
jgi:RNA methyltransferase, TrmH family